MTTKELNLDVHRNYGNLKKETYKQKNVRENQDWCVQRNVFRRDLKKKVHKSIFFLA